MRYIEFRLTMPNIGSWNGKWSGSNDYFAITKSFKKEKDVTVNKILESNSYRYDFGDGWTALVSVKEITSHDRKIIKKKSKGFCGYDWMVNSIIQNNKIISR